MDDHGRRRRFRDILASGGVIAPSVADPIFARLVQDCGFQLMHLAGNVMHRSLLLPDQSMVTMTEMAHRARTIVEALDIPLLVDGETGYGGPEQTARAVREFERAGAAGIRFEDSLFGANGISVMGTGGVTPVPEMVDKIKAAADARSDADLVLMVRCDARPVEPVEQILERTAAYVAAGADAIGVTLSDAEELRRVGASPPAPLVNPWPRAGVNTAAEFFGMGYRVALMTSNVYLAGLAAARTMLVQLREMGSLDAYFASVPDLEPVRRWYADLGFRPTQPF